MIPDTIYTGDNVATLKTFPDACIDLVVTSPPYDNLRTYGGHTWDFEGVARELTRVLKPGGVIVWVVADATVKGSETLTSMRQAIHFKDVCGLNVHDTMIWNKSETNFPDTVRYSQSWEYMVILSKGAPKTTNLIADRQNKSFGRMRVGTDRSASGETRKSYTKPVKEMGVRMNLWCVTPEKGNIRREHPATFPLDLARDHILSWSNEGDVVLDPFAGSGTTCLAARDAGRQYVGIEINPEYVEIINRRLGLANHSISHHEK